MYLKTIHFVSHYIHVFIGKLLLQVDFRINYLQNYIGEFAYAMSLLITKSNDYQSTDSFNIKGWSSF